MMSLVSTENWDYRLTDTLRGLLTALRARRTGEDSSIAVPELGSCIPVRSARVAIVIALKALSLRAGALIAVPLYCCPVVLAAIKAAGCGARFIDVDPDNYCMSADDLAAKSFEVDAVIAVHMFGNVCDMPALRRAAPGKVFIEDCAQALGSRFGGKAVGSFGEIAVFSFRSGKYVSAGEGGVVYCRQSDLKSRVLKLISELPLPSHLDDCIHVFKTYVRSLLRSKPLWGLVGSRLWAVYAEEVDSRPQAPIVMGQIYATDRDTAVRRLPVLDALIERQRSNANYYSRTLTVNADMLCSETPGTFFNRLQYPLLLPTSEQCDELQARLRKEQISTARPYKDIARIAAADYGYAGDCPRAERIARTVLVIPCNYSLNAADLERVAATVNQAWAEIGGRQGQSMPSATVRNLLPPKTRDRGTITEPHHFL